MTQLPLDRLRMMWDKGVLGRGEFITRLFEVVTPESLSQFLLIVPYEILAEMREDALRAPKTDAEWARTILIESNCGGKLTAVEAEQDQQLQVQRLKQFRLGNETLRSYFNPDHDTNQS